LRVCFAILVVGVPTVYSFSVEYLCPFLCFFSCVGFFFTCRGLIADWGAVHLLVTVATFFSYSLCFVVVRSSPLLWVGAVRLDVFCWFLLVGLDPFLICVWSFVLGF